MNIFETIATFAKKDFTNFGMSNNWLGSVNGFGELTCIYQDTVIAADTWKMAHNVMVKLPPLVAPAFTRIKAVINSFYVSYASVWKHWNSFISDKPDDVFLNRSLLRGYKGKFVEPCCNMMLIAYICKIAKGNFTVGEYLEIDDVSYAPLLTCFNTSTVSGFYNSITWRINDGLRQAVVTPVDPDAVIGGHDTSGFFKFRYDVLTYDGYNMLTIFPVDTLSALVSEHADLGFYDRISATIYACQSVVRNLESMGVPCDLIAQTDLQYYKDDLFNLLPGICVSSVWQNFYRDEQNQSPEFDYSEVNGQLEQVQPSDAYAYAHQSGWYIRLNGLPLNLSASEPLWFKVNTLSKAFAVLTGFALRYYVSETFKTSITSENITILPSHYNGLLLTRYRNFEKDYFTSACVDPMMGAVSVSTPSTIEALRTASKLEEFLERSASARDFYNFMKYNFGTNPESTRYKKPLLLGTKIIPIQISEQLQTSETANTPLGERAGVADGYGNGGTCDHYFNEHGHIFSFLSFVLDSQYMQGLPHQFFHHKQLDYPFPDFANLGAESIETKEIYYSNHQTLSFDPQSKYNNVSQLYSPDGAFPQEKVNTPSQFNSVHAPESLEDAIDNGLGVSFGERSVVDNVGANHLNVVPDGDFKMFATGSVSDDSEMYGVYHRHNNGGFVGVPPSSVGGTSLQNYVYDSGLKIGGASGASSDLGYGAAVKSDIPTSFLPGQSKVFGYVPRYSRWKWHNDVVCGQMRSELEFWHTFRQFSQVPYISHSFVSYEDAGFVSDLNRIFSVENDNSDKFYLDIFNNCSVRRCLPLVANPQIN